MTRIWTNYDNKGEKIIAFVNATLYKANPKEEELEFLVARMQANDFSDTSLFGIPLDYVRDIRLQEGNDHIQVFFGRDSEEHFLIKDETLREEIFAYLKEHIPGSSYRVDRYDKMRAATKPMAGLIVVALLFIYTLFIMNELDHGGTVYSTGRISALLIGLISLGTVNVYLIFGALIGIAGFSMIRKMSNPPVVHVISMGRQIRN